MPYSAKEDIQQQISDEKLAQLTSEEGNTIDEIVVDKAIADADAVIDSYLAKVYSVPVSPTPARVNQLSVTIALYLLFSRRASDVGGVNETIRDNYDDAIRFLERAADGKVTIGIDPPPKGASSTGGKFKAEDRTFTKKSMEGL